MESETMTDKQLLILSRIPSSISASNLKDQRRLQEYHCEVLCHVFLFCESKSPLKQAAISENLSPIQLMDVILKCHSALRAAVTVLQKYLASVRGKAQNGDMSVQKSLKDMLSVSVKLLNNELIPLDSKGNCGIVVVILLACLHDDGYNLVLDKLLSKTSAFPTVDKCVEPVYFASEVAQMSICSGLVTVTPAEILFSINRNQEKYYLETVFMKLLSLDEGIESSLSLGCSRALQQALHSIHDAVLKNSSSDCILMLSNTQILSMCLNFVWSRMEHFMDCVRHAAKAMLQDLVQIGSTFKERDVGDTSFLQSILAAVERIPSYKKSKYIALAVLASEIGCQKLLTVFPCLAATLLPFLEDPSLSAHVSNAYESLMLKHFKEEGMDIWINAWISPLFEAYPKSNVCYVIEGIIKKAMAACPALLDYAVSLYGEGNSLTSSQLKVFIVCLKIGTKLGVVEKRFKKDSVSNEHIKWMGIMKYDVIKQALMNKDDEVRLSALSLMVESNKTTQPLKPVELELMKCFLLYNVNSDVPSLRQKNLMLLMKFLVRVKDSSFPLLKVRNQHKDKGGKTCETLVGYRQFLKWFEQFCFKCLFPGANHPRQASALEMLTMLDEIIPSTDKPVLMDDKQFLYSKDWQENNAESLLLCLRDSFESNKVLALNLLMKYPAEILGFTNPLKFQKLLTTSLRLASSVKPPDCITSAYLLKLLVSFPETEGKLEEAASEITSSLLEDFPSFSKETTFYEKSTFCMLWILVAQLERELAAAKANILVAAANGPLYGTLFCIRNLLKNLDFQCIAENAFWKKMILKLIPLCFEINSAVIHIVNSSSPEGHLPMDFAPVCLLVAIAKESLKNIKESEEREDSSEKLSPVTAQMVLLCSWRTVKEVSLFLGDVTNQASIYSESSPQAQECSLLSEDLVMSIGDYFTKLLSETKHRGAFEQAYVGFCNICKKLWKHPSGILSQLPKIWLKDITNEITRGKQASKLCATRRSAGVPFIVQNPLKFQKLLTTSLRLASSVKPPDCITSAYLLKLLVSFPETEGKLEEAASEITSSLLEDFPSFSKETTFYEKSTFCMLWILVAQLERELAAAKANILVAAANGPLYGTLFCIRNLLKNLDFQ
ncbi:hypothetical protein J437_LFUL009835 [Ladona fulva]|uniref:Uncharacterized protein n=1 Tax=Ladona fulva TaxID=123851 RepID=A0A8K0K9K7_LADFU|nr:hypothetical protein J437_LFUL009835 [Ladona fulva]